MALKILTDAERQAGHTKFEEQYQPPEVISKNSLHTAMMDVPMLFPWNGILFQCDPISVPDGLIVSDLVNRWDREVVGKNSPEARAAAAEIFLKGCALLQRLTRPQGISRFLWRWTGKKAFVRATEAQFVNLMRFLLLCRMR